MSGDQEPWVFRGGLTADLQVGRQDCACEQASKAQAAACVRASEPARHTLCSSGTVNRKHYSLDTTDLILLRDDYQILKLSSLSKVCYTYTVNAWLPAI